jgi:hypothetical protein
MLIIMSICRKRTRSRLCSNKYRNFCCTRCTKGICLISSRRDATHSCAHCAASPRFSSCPASVSRIERRSHVAKGRSSPAYRIAGSQPCQRGIDRVLEHSLYVMVHYYEHTNERMQMLAYSPRSRCEFDFDAGLVYIHKLTLNMPVVSALVYN